MLTSFLQIGQCSRTRWPFTQGSWVSQQVTCPQAKKALLGLFSWQMVQTVIFLRNSSFSATSLWILRLNAMRSLSAPASNSLYLLFILLRKFILSYVSFSYRIVAASSREVYLQPSKRTGLDTIEPTSAADLDIFRMITEFLAMLRCWYESNNWVRVLTFHVEKWYQTNNSLT